MSPRRLRLVAIYVYIALMYGCRGRPASQQPWPPGLRPEPFRLLSGERLTRTYTREHREESAAAPTFPNETIQRDLDSYMTIEKGVGCRGRPASRQPWQPVQRPEAPRPLSGGRLRARIPAPGIDGDALDTPLNIFTLMVPGSEVDVLEIIQFDALICCACKIATFNQKRFG